MNPGGMQVNGTEMVGRRGISASCREEFPQALRDGVNYEVVKLEPEEAHVRLVAGEQQLRPGGTDFRAGHDGNGGLLDLCACCWRTTRKPRVLR